MTALRLGYRHIDTAELYRNEESVGKAVCDFILESGVSREDIWVTTKLWPNQKDYSDVKASLSQSLLRLGLEYVDLYLIHSPNDQANRLEQWRALVDLQRDGLARSIGVSNYGVHHLEELLRHFDTKPAVNQIELSPFLTRSELVAFCHENQIAVESYSPLTKGEKLREPKVLLMANKYNCTPAQLLLQWSLQHGFITIPKSVTPSRIEENLLTLQMFESNAISETDVREMDGWNEGLVTGWNPTTGA
jgi:diketogulonate reductase-like aldo/keto reductase